VLDLYNFLDFHIMRVYTHNMEKIDFSFPLIRGDKTEAKIPGSQSVYRAIAALRCVARHNRTGITAKSLASETKLIPATAHRLLKVLVSEGMLTVDPYSKTYHLGLELFQMGSVAHDFSVTRYLEAPLLELMEVTGETVFLFIRSGTDSLCLRRIDGHYPIRVLTLTEGSRRPLGVGAGGMALLAGQTDELCDRILASNMARYADYFNTTLDEMKHQIAATRADGFSFNDGRLHDGVRAVGMSVGPEGCEPVAAISVVTSQQRMAPAKRQFLQESLRTGLNGLDWTLLKPDQNIMRRKT